MENSSKKGVDPGWNDPPMLNYSESNPPPKSRIGNKRVAFPLGTSSPQSTSSSPSRPPVAKSEVEVEEKVPDMFNSTFSNFEQTMKVHTNDDVITKMELMKNMWRTDQLSNSVKNDLYDLSCFLVKNEIENANKLHLKLLMTSSSQCKSWISCIQFFMNSLAK